MPSHLKPASDKSLGAEIAHMAGGAQQLAARALELSQKGNHALACHLVDWAFIDSPDDDNVKSAVNTVYTARAQTESSTMAMGIFLSAAQKSGVHSETEAGFVFDLQDNRGRGKRTQ
jgi:alkyl sulfatase BDS1-like metallo-beta-lactamase superfamily hydrolase